MSGISGYANDAGDVGEDMYNRGGESSGAGLTKKIQREAPPIGYVKPIADPRLIKYDRVAARTRPKIAWDASRGDRMSMVDAGNKMEAVYDLFGLRGAEPEVLEAFHNALYHAHTLNGASVLKPGRNTITVGGNVMAYQALQVFLGVDERRFFRAYADEIRNANLRTLSAAHDRSDIVTMEKAQMLLQVAQERGMSRYPELAFDSADAVPNLTDGEFSAIVSSKSAIFSTSANMADRNRQRPGQSMDTVAGSMYVQPSAQVQAQAAH